MSGEPAVVTLAPERDTRPRVAAWCLAHRWPLVLSSAMVAWSLALFATVRSHYVDLRLGRFDLGNMVQAVWSTAHGRPLEVTELSGEQVTRLAGHVDPILVLLAPAWLVVPSPLTLAAIQIAACGLGALPLYWLGRRHLESDRAAALVALAYLAYPWLAWTALDAFHPVTLAIPLFLFAIWFLDADRMWAFAACAALILVTGELMGVTLAALGLWYALSRHRRGAGLVIAAVGLLWSGVALEVIVPAFRDDQNVFYGYYESVGGSPGGVIRTTFTDPGAIVGALTSGADLAYLFWLAAPLVGLFLLAPGLAAVALPQLLANGLSDWTFTTDPHHHYLAAIVPFLAAATVLGIAKLPPASRGRIAALVLAVSATSCLIVGPWPGTPGEGRAARELSFTDRHLDAVRAAVALVPKDAPVSATNRVGSQLSARRYVYSVPVLGRAEWVVVDRQNPWVAGTVRESLTGTLGRDPRALESFIDRLSAGLDWRMMFERDDVLVFRKRSAP